MILKQNLIWIVFSFLLSCGSPSSDSDNSSLLSCPETTSFSEDADDSTSFGSFSEIDPTTSNDPINTRTIQLVTKGNLDLIKIYDSLDEYKEDPRNILVFGQQVKNLSETQITNLKYVLHDAGKCLFADEIDEATRQCLEALLEIDHDSNSDLNETQANLCQLSNSGASDDTYNSITYCKTEFGISKHKIYDPLLAKGDTSYGEISTNLTTKMCNEFQGVYDFILTSQQDTASLTSVDKKTGIELNDCTGMSSVLCKNQPSLFSHEHQTASVTRGDIEFVENGSKILETTGSLIIYRTTNFSPEGGTNQCKDTWCDVYLYQFASQIYSEVTSGTAATPLLDSLILLIVVGPHGVTPLPMVTTLSGENKSLLGCGVLNMAVGSYLDSFSLTSEIKTPGYYIQQTLQDLKAL